jgi:hypothetical protein
MSAARQGIHGEILQYRQWVAWRYGKIRSNGKRAKEPINPRTGELAKANDPETWADHTKAVSTVELYGLNGIGFMFSKDDPFVGVDLDGCIKDGEIAPWALNIVGKLDSYAEISPSGTGIKGIVRGSLPTDKTGVRRSPVELYQHGRFFTITGEELEPGSGIAEAQDCQEPLEKLYRRVEAASLAASPTREPRTAQAGFSGDDERLLEKAARKKPFPALYYAGDTSGFASQSDADLALCGTLAFWTGKDAKRMDRLFRGSALYREKWERPDYRRSTIETAISRCRNVYTGQAQQSGREDVIARFQAEREAVDRLPFDWRGGDTDYKLSHALIDTGVVVGSISGDHPTVAMSERDMLTGAGIGSRETVRRGLERLIESGRIEVVEPGGKRTAATYRLRFSEVGAKVDHKGTHTTVFIMDQSCPHRTNVTKMRAPYNPPRKRYDKNGRPAPNYTGHLEKRLPARCGQIYRYLVANPGGSLEEIATNLEMNTRDGRRDLKRRYMKLLISFGLVEERDGGYYPAKGHEERFAEYLEQSGCNAAEERQRDRIERERLAYELHGLEQKIAYDFEQPGYDPGEPIPELVEPILKMPEEPAPEPDSEGTGGYTHTTPSVEATESPTMVAPEPSKGNVPAVEESAVDDDWHSHEILCECDACLYPAPSYASPKLLPGDSGRSRIAPPKPIPTYANSGDATDRQSAAA